MKFVYKKFFFLVILFLFCAVPLSVFAKTSMYISPQNGSYSVSEEFTIKILVQADDREVNAVSGKLFYDTSMIEVLSVNINNSPIEFWTVKPKINDSFVSFEGLFIENILQDKTIDIFDIRIKGLKSGITSLDLSEVSVLYNDGHGTNIVDSISGSSFTFVKEDVFVESSESEHISKKEDDKQYVTVKIFVDTPKDVDKKSMLSKNLNNKSQKEKSISKNEKEVISYKKKDNSKRHKKFIYIFFIIDILLF